MTTEKISKLISNYVDKMDIIYDDNHFEYYKWQAVQKCQAVWNPEAEDLGAMICSAFSMSANLIENNWHKPITGLLKLCAADADAVRTAFANLLAAGNIGEKGAAIHSFTTGINELMHRAAPDPRYYHTQQDTMMYLAFLSPDQNYMIKYPIFQTFYLFAEGERSKGSENEIDLMEYDHTCAELKQMLWENRELMDALDQMLARVEEKNKLPAGTYQDMPGKVNILVYELMYAAEIYELYRGIKKTPVRPTASAATVKKEEKKSHYQSEFERLSLRKEDSEGDLEQIGTISVMGYQVTNRKKQVGKVVDENDTTISVEFADGVKKFMIPDCFVKGFLTIDNDEIMRLFKKKAELTARLKVLNANISAAKIEIERNKK